MDEPGLKPGHVPRNQHYREQFSSVSGLVIIHADTSPGDLINYDD